ncbi:MAG: KEOPS complex subunit Pcc1 [Ferroplasma sp.]
MFKVTLTLEREKYSDYIEAIKPEATETFGRSGIELMEDNKNIYIVINAPDASSLRASVSSLTRVLNIVKKVMEENVW